jgi:hypothetical protein
VLVHDALHELVMAYVAADDRAWFDARTDEPVRWRPAFDHEFCSPSAFPRCELAFAVPLPPPGFRPTLMVEIRRVTPGVRTRAPYWVIEAEAVAL